ncbi:MAG: 50S ribosomal protein L30 [Rhodothermales bacterium]
MAKLKITQSRSIINSSGKQRRTIEALGLRRLHHSVTHEDTPVIRGMIDKVSHLVEVEEADS